MTGAPLGLPAELFPLAKTANSKLGGFRLSLRFIKREHQDVQIQETFVSRGDRHDVVVKQVWRNGEKFWREYERHYKGRLDLRAKVAATSIASLAGGRPDPIPSKEQKVPGPTPKAQPPVNSQKSAPKDAHARRDPKRQVKLSVAERPKLQGILESLRESTGLSFTLAEELQDHQRDFGKVQLRNVPAWVVMGLVTESQMRDARWEKSDTGYHLVGKSLAVPKPSTNPWLVALWWVGGGIVALGALWAIRRRLGKKEKVLAATAK
jgi:hypothetical protein